MLSIHFDSNAQIMFWLSLNLCKHQKRNQIPVYLLCKLTQNVAELHILLVFCVCAQFCLGLSWIQRTVKPELWIHCVPGLHSTSNSSIARSHISWRKWILFWAEFKVCKYWYTPEYNSWNKAIFSPNKLVMTFSQTVSSLFIHSPTFPATMFYQWP